MDSKEPVYQGRRWCITWWPKPEDASLDPGSDVLDWCEYFIWAEEFGEKTGKRHSQAYLFTKKKMTKGGVIRKLTACGYVNAEVIRANGTHDECIAYVTGPYEKKGKSKPVNESATAYGTRPLEAGEGEKKKWEEVRELARAGKFDEIPAQFEICYYNNLRRIHVDAKDAEDAEEPCGIFIHGHSGAGKSYDARSIVAHDKKRIYNKGWTKWWDGYKDQELVLLEDADPIKVKGLDQELKIWSDRYAFCPEVKGATAGMIRPKYVVITSQYSMEELFKDPETLWALRRRFAQKRRWIDKVTKERKEVCRARYTADQCRDKEEDEVVKMEVEDKDVTGFGGYGMV